MLAVAGDFCLENGLQSSQAMDATATWELDRVGEGGR